MVKSDHDTSYVLGKTGTLNNDDYSWGTRGTVHVQVKAGKGRGDTNMGPVLKATIHYTNGSTVRCEKFRSTIWETFDQYETQDLVCEAPIALDGVGRVTVHS